MKKFPPLGTIGAGLLTLLLAVWSAAAEPAAASPVFRFIHLTDCHVTDDLGDRYRRANDKLQSVINDVTHAKWGARYDFVMATGDMAHAFVPKLLAQDNDLAAAMLRRFNLPVMVTAGNHEVFQGEGDDLREAPYLRNFGYGTLTYAVRYRGVLFIMVNNSGGIAGRDAVADRRNAIVARLLEQFPDEPKIIACHIPLVSMRDEAVLKASTGFSTYKLVGDQGLLQIIEKHADTVIAVIAGHLHLTGHVVVNGIHHITASGTASYPSHYGEYTVYEDRIHVTMRQPDRALLQRFDGKVHDRKGIAYTDAAHPTHDDYVSGVPAEREFDIPLSGRKLIRNGHSLFTRNPQGWIAPFSSTKALGATTTEVANLGAEDQFFCVPFLLPSKKSLFVSSPDGGQLFLNPRGGRAWTPDDLRGGVPVRVAGGGVVTIQGTEEEPTGAMTPVDTQELLRADKARREALVKVRVGMRFWSDRSYLVDQLPPELIGLERAFATPCHGREIVIRRDAPGKAYAVFLPSDGKAPARAEIEQLGWRLYKEKAFNGVPYPRSLSKDGYDIYVRELRVGENRLVEPRPEPASTWAVVALSDN